MKKIFLIFTILLFGCHAFGANWVRMDKKMYIDNSSIKIYGDYSNDSVFSVWSKWMNNESDSWKKWEKKIGKKLTYKKVQNIVDCENKKLAVKSMVLYDSNDNAAGRYEKGALKWRDVVPETMGEDIYSYVCRVKYVVRRKTIFGRRDWPVGVKTWERAR